MRRSIFAIAAILGATLILSVAGCGSSSGDAVPGPADGTYRGTIEDSGSLDPITVVIAGGSITVTIPAGTLTGTFAQEVGNIYGFNIDGTDGGFILDASGTRAGFVNEVFSFGAVQKDAVSPPGSYAQGDLTGSWTGEYAETDFLFELIAYGSTQVTVAGGGSFNGSSDAPDTFNGTLTLDDASYGRYTGTVTSSGYGSGTVSAFVTPDKAFAASYACFPNSGAFPDGCTFNFWSKQ